LQAYRKVRAYSLNPHLAVIYEIAPQWEENHFVALMKWVEGMPLSDLKGVLLLHAEDIGEVSCESLVLRWLGDLCEALSSLHRVNLVHGDVTPKNIIVSGGDITLTDFDAVIEGGGKPRIETALYSAPSISKYKNIWPTDDVYALAASFFHVLFDQEPFRFEGELRKDYGLNWEGINKHEWPLLAKFFDKATNPNQQQRFKSAMDAELFLKQLQFDTEQHKETKILIESEVEKLTPNEVPRLLDILRSYPGSLKGNDETRGLDSEFAEQTYVETRLDRVLYDEITNGEVNLVILFGNAGDGKTAFLQHLAIKLGLQKQHSSQRLWDHAINGIRVRANMDGSAAYKGKTSIELLDAFFYPFHDCNPPKDLVHLIAINSGPLQAWILDFEQRYGQTLLTEQLQAVLDGDISQLHSRLRFLDLNNRSLVGGISDESSIISTDFLDKLMDKLLEFDKENLWKPCQTCSANNRCTAWESVQLLRHPQKGKLIRNRFYEALQAVHQRGEVHITARELRAALCYIFFGLYYCSDLHEDPDLSPGHYYERAFDPISPHRQGEVLHELVFLDPSLEAHPKIDRYLLGHNDAERNISQPYCSGLSLKSARRRAYFELDREDISKILSDKSFFGLAHGQYLKLFRDFPLLSNEDKTQICMDICKGIAKLEDLPSIAFDNPDGVPLKIVPRTPTESALWVLKPFKNFSLNAETNSTMKGLENLHTHLLLIYHYRNGNEERLFLGAELFHILMELKNGVQLSDAASEDTFANLSIFTQRLAQEDSREFFAWNPIEENVIFKVGVNLKNDVQTITCSRLV